MTEELRVKRVPVTDGQTVRYANTYVLSEYDLVNSETTDVNAFVPTDAPIQPPQAFVDAMIDLVGETQSQLLISNNNFEMPLVSGGDSLAITNPALSHLTATVTITGDSANVLITQVYFPNLTDIVGSFTISGVKINAIDFSRLSSIAGTLSLGGTGSLASISFPSLTTVDGTLSFDQSVDVASASFPALTTLNGALIVTGDALTTVSFPLLDTIGTGADLELGQGVTDGGAFHSLSLPALTTLGGAIGIDPCIFSSAEIDALFNALASTITSVGGSAVAELRFQNQQPAAPPTAASAAARTYLSGLGINIIVDP